MLKGIKKAFSSDSEKKSKKKPKKVLYKIFLMGAEQSGKSSLLNQYVHRSFKEAYSPSVIPDFISKEVMIDDTYCSLQFWDTAGQRYTATNTSAIGTSCYRSADCCLFVFDVANENSFNQLNLIKDYFWTHCEEPQLPLFLIGNKIDRTDRKVTKTQAEEWCKANGNITYLECCAKDSALTNKTFEDIVRLMITESAPKQQRQLPKQPAEKLPSPLDIASPTPSQEATQTTTNSQTNDQVSVKKDSPLNTPAPSVTGSTQPKSQAEIPSAQKSQSTTSAQQSIVQPQQNQREAKPDEKPTQSIQPSRKSPSSSIKWRVVLGSVIVIAAVAFAKFYRK